MTNFIVHGLARSRTAWLSRFLTYKDHACYHELAITMRSPEDYKKLFSSPNTGSSETGAAQGWWLLKYYKPEIKTVVVFRPIKEVVDSLLDVDLSGVAHYDKPSLVKHLEYGQRCLDKISNDPDTLSVHFKDLIKMETCQKIFEHCLPYKFDIKWWGALKNQNIQVSVQDKLKYYHENKEAIMNFKSLCKKELIKVRREDPDNLLWKRVN